MQFQQMPLSVFLGGLEMCSVYFSQPQLSNKWEIEGQLPPTQRPICECINEYTQEREKLCIKHAINAMGIDIYIYISTHQFPFSVKT